MTAEFEQPNDFEPPEVPRPKPRSRGFFFTIGALIAIASSLLTAGATSGSYKVRFETLEKHDEEKAVLLTAHDRAIVELTTTNKHILEELKIVNEQLREMNR